MTVSESRKGYKNMRNKKLWEIVAAMMLCLGIGSILSGCGGKEENVSAEQENVSAEQNWLTEGDSSDEYYRHTCESFEFMEFFKNPDSYKGSRITASVKIVLVDEPVYYACDSEGEEYYILDNRNDKSQKIMLDDQVQVFGEFLGVGTDGYKGSGVDSDDFIIEARIIEKQELVYKDVTDTLTQSRLEAMLPVFDSLLLVGSGEDAMSYMPKDSTYFWRAMYMMLANYGEGHVLASVEDGILTLRRMAVQEYATALFYDYDDLPLEELKAFPQITYDENWDAVKVSLSDRGDSAVRIVSMCDIGAGDYLVTAQLWDPDTEEVYYTGEFELKPNPYADAVAEPVYYFSVNGVDITKEGQ